MLIKNLYGSNLRSKLASTPTCEVLTILVTYK